MINVTFTGNIFHSDGVTPAQDVRYQGYFIKVNPNSSETIWDTPRLSETNQYNFNLGDNTWLSQDAGYGQPFDKVLLCFWLPGTSQRDGQDLTEWAFIEWELDTRDVYVQNIQLMGHSTPTCSFAVSGSNPVYIIDTGSTDDSQWIFEGKEHYQAYEWEGYEIFSINNLPSSPVQIFWGDTSSNTYPLSGAPFEHSYDTPDDYLIEVQLTNSESATCSAGFEHRVYNEVDNGLTWGLPVNINVPVTYVPDIYGDLVSIAGVDYYIDGDIVHTDLAYNQSFDHTFVNNGNHVIKQCIKYTDGFDNQIQCEDFTVEMNTKANYVDSDYDCGLVFTDTSDIGAPPAVKYQWDISDGMFLLAHVEGVVYSDWYYAWPYKGTFQVRLAITDSNDQESSITKEYVVTECKSTIDGSGDGGGGAPWIYQETNYRGYDKPLPTLHIVSVDDCDLEKEPKVILILEITDKDEII
jgi:hypothetical protein